MHLANITLTVATVAFVAWMAIVAPRGSALSYQPDSAAVIER
jgi:hypothetical protein